MSKKETQQITHNEHHQLHQPPGITIEDLTLRSYWLRRVLITFGCAVLVVVAILLVRHLVVSKTNYRAWLIGTAGNCLVRVDTLSGDLNTIACHFQHYSNGTQSPWNFQSGITDNRHRSYYATFSYQNEHGDALVDVGQFNLQTGEILRRTELSFWIPVRNFSHIQINPERNHTRLVGVVTYQNETGSIHQGIGVFVWKEGKGEGEEEEASFFIAANWGQLPHPVLGVCCSEGPHRLCFPQGGLEPKGESYEIYSFPQCKTLYEWRTDNGTEVTVKFDYNLVLVNWSEKLKSLLSVAMLPIPARPGRKQADVALIKNDDLIQTNVLVHNLEYIRVPLETSLDDEKGRLYVLLGVPSNDGLTASQLRVYAVDVSVSGDFRLVTVSDFHPSVVYPTSIANIWYQKDYDA